MRTISAFLLLGLLLFGACRAWLDFASAVPMPGQVQSLHRGWQGENRFREYDFGTCRYTVVEYDPLLAGYLGFFGADAPELSGIAEGDRVPLWALPASGRATPVLRMPIATTIVPLLFLALLLAERRSPAPKATTHTTFRVQLDGSTEVRREQHRCLGCIFIDTAVPMAIFASLLLIAWAIAAPFLEGEATLREGLAFATVVLLAAPVFSLIFLNAPVPSVRWNDSTVWIHGVPFQRSAIRKVLLRNGILEIHREGSRWKRSFAKEAAWTAGQLEKLGIVPET